MRFWRAGDLAAGEESFKVLATTAKTQFATMVLRPGETSGEFGNEHAQADQWLVVLEGDGEAVAESGNQKIGPGDVVLIPAPEKHQFKCTGASVLKTITFYGPVAYPDEG
jgi:mannose-6-phosphate isomerase-like protein (cupin superfamily)